LRNQGVVVRGQLRYVRPQLLFGIFDLSTSLRASRDVELNYNVRTFGGDVTLTHRPTEWFRYDFGYVLELVREDSTVRDYQDAYRIGYLKASAQADFRDDILQPSKGAFIGLEARLGEPGIGEFFFTSVTPDVRGYIPMGDRVTLGLRAMAGWIFDFTADDQIPQDYRLYGGGATDFRGVPYRRLSPYSYTVRNDDIEIVGNPFFPTEEACQERLDEIGITEDFNCEAEPTGGFFKALFSVEPRFEIGKDWLYGAVFADFGTVQRDVNPDFAFGGNTFHVAVGGGLRLATPVGPIRADVGYRITDSPNFGDIRDVTFYIAVGEAF
jgi:outer membrane protein assembly factor BamA